MPETKITVVFFEGDDDKAFLEGLDAAKLLPPGWQLANRMKDQHRGKDGLIRQLLPLISPVNGIDGRAVVLVDLDELTLDQRAEWFRVELQKALQRDEKHKGVVLEPAAGKGRVKSFRLVAGDRVGHVAVVPVGQPDAPDFHNQYQIDRFALDDWVFRLVLNQKIFENISDLNSIKYHIAVKKFSEVAKIFRENGLEVRKAKTYLQILRAAAAITPSTATIVGRIVKKGHDALGRDAFVALTQPFLDDLAAAAGLVNL
jgi:hypothetical protein